jgi:hypothetical protein
MIKKVMKLIDPSTGLMECRVCGGKHWANVREGGHYYRGNWQCQHGCKPPERSAIYTDARASAP